MSSSRPISSSPLPTCTTGWRCRPRCASRASGAQVLSLWTRRWWQIWVPRGHHLYHGQRLPCPRVLLPLVAAAKKKKKAAAGSLDVLGDKVWHLVLALGALQVQRQSKSILCAQEELQAELQEVHTQVCNAYFTSRCQAASSCKKQPSFWGLDSPMALCGPSKSFPKTILSGPAEAIRT